MKCLRLLPVLALLSPPAFAGDASVDDAFRQAQSQDMQKTKNKEAAQEAGQKAREKAQADKVRAALIKGTAAALGSPVVKQGSVKINQDALMDSVEMAGATATVGLKDGRTCQFSFDQSNVLFGMGASDDQNLKDVKALATEMPYLQGLIPDAQFAKLRAATSGAGSFFGGEAHVQLAYTEAGLEFAGSAGSIDDWNVTTECFLNGKKSEKSFSGVSFNGAARVYPENEYLTQLGEGESAPVEPPHHEHDHDFEHDRDHDHHR
jgi:hypothetical protein